MSLPPFNSLRRSWRQTLEREERERESKIREGERKTVRIGSKRKGIAVRAGTC